MSISSVMKDYVGYGLAADLPVTPNIAAVAGFSSRYYATDTTTEYAWDGSAWQVVSGGGGGGGYTPGTVPTVVQIANSVAGGNSAVFTGTPASGNLLVAMCFNPTSDTAGSGWTKQFENSSGSDYGIILTKVCGGSESKTQSPLSGVSTDGVIMIWELHGQNVSTPFVFAASQAEQAGALFSAPVLVPNATNCIGLSALAASNSGSQTIVKALNIGTQDLLSNTGASRVAAAGHTDLSQTPFAGIAALFSASLNSKAATCLISS